MNTRSNEVYSCMLCNKIFASYPENGKCDICGTSIDNRTLRLTTLEDSKRILIKISDENAINSMRNGVFWFQSPKYFQNYQGNDAIGDVVECAYEKVLDISQDLIETHSSRGKGDIVEIDGQMYKYERSENGKVYVSSVYQNYNRLLCFYSLYLDENGKIIVPDEKMKQFGSHFSIIIDRPVLEKRIKSYIGKLDYNVEYRAVSVNYLSEKYNGIYTPSCKFDKYKYQNEYRIILQSENYNKMPEEQKVVINIEKEGMSTIMTNPIPIERLWNSEKLEDLIIEISN